MRVRDLLNMASIVGGGAKKAVECPGQSCQRSSVLGLGEIGAGRDQKEGTVWVPRFLSISPGGRSEV